MFRSKPEFVILGAQVEHKCVLVASQELTEVEIRENFEREQFEWIQDTTDHKIELTANLKSYVTIYANTWAEAWELLFQVWTPADKSAGEIKREVRQIRDVRKAIEQ